ncbi:MAG: thermonuclease family protein [Candidatus Aminicenantes bacterium]|nr:MAG: thermonuclease family protein [Candidatus Aminicenantes bacterium]
MKKTLVFLLCFSLFPSQNPKINNGKVVAIYDGDTVKVRSDIGFERRVRLIGIDTPEIEDSPVNTPLEALLAKRFTFHHLFRKRVKLSYEKEMEDQYGRLLAYVWTEKGLFNEFILKEGFARVFLKFSYGMREKFVRIQKEAQRQAKGFWREEPYPILATQQVRNHIGKLCRVQFRCASIKKSGSLVFLLAKSGDFAALIPKGHLSLFSNIQSMKGKTAQVFGFLEGYRGQSQIMLFFPSQITSQKGDGSIFFLTNRNFINVQ